MGQSKPFGRIQIDKILTLVFWEDPEDSKNLNDESKIWDMLLVLDHPEIIWGLAAVRRSIYVSQGSSILFE